MGASEETLAILFRLSFRHKFFRFLKVLESDYLASLATPEDVPSAFEHVVCFGSEV